MVVGHSSDVVARERRVDRAAWLARQVLRRIGEEFRDARLAADLTQLEVGRAVGISDSQYSRIERGEAPYVSYATLAAIAVVLGLDLPLRAYPAGDPVRDRAQLDLLARFRDGLPGSLGWRTEVPLDIPGDRRAWDAEIAGDGWRIAVEAETRLRDVQALSRRLALKSRDAGVARLILVVADTRHNRRTLRLARVDLAAMFPLGSRAVLEALHRGNPPEESGIVVV
jgi:transcriptional regulator with XRE-family HTH domain